MTTRTRVTIHLVIEGEGDPDENRTLYDIGDDLLDAGAVQELFNAEGDLIVLSAEIDYETLPPGRDGTTAPYDRGTLLQRVLAVMQEGEELGGPEGEEYVETMEKIAEAALERAGIYREILAKKGKS